MGRTWRARAARLARLAARGAGVAVPLACLVGAGCGGHHAAPPSSMTPRDLGVADLAAPPGAPDLAAPAAPSDAAPPLADGAVAGLPPVDWRTQVIYLAMTDRFFNGSSANDALGLPGCFDPTNPQLFHGGDFVGVQQKSGYLSELGVSTLWLTPVYRQATGPTGKCGYHGYWADFVDPDDGAVEPRFGTADELTSLVGALHAAGIRFIQDMVVNHAGDGARIATQHPDWFHDPTTCATLGDPSIYCPYRVGIHDFAQEKPEVAAYLDGVSAGWVTRYPVDGIRMDTAKYVLPSYFHDSWVPAVRAVRPLFLVAEVFSESAPDLKPYLDAGFDSAFNFPLRRALVDAFGHALSVDEIATVVAQEQSLLGARAAYLVNLLDNHDTGRFASEPGALATDELAHRLQLGLVALFALPGIPQIYTGDELGILGGNDPDNRRDMPSWAWAAADRAGTHDGALPNADQTFALVERLIAARRATAALADGDYVELWRQNGAANANVYAFWRGDGQSRAIAAFNDGAAAATVALPIAGNAGLAGDRAALADGVVLDELAQAGAPAAATISGGALPLALPAKTAALLRPRDPGAGCAVTFTVQAPSGAPVSLAGSTAELGAWDPARAVAMSASCTGTTCAYSVTLRVLPFNQSIEFKFIHPGATPVWEGGANRTLTIPSTATTSYDGQSFQ